MISTILFDLDGTLIDSAPDLAAALNEQRRRRRKPPLPYHLLRLHASSGARGMIKAGFSVEANDLAYQELRDEFLEIYARELLLRTQPFPDVDNMLAAIERSGRTWGIVTNKATSLAMPLLDAFALTSRAACIVCGDSTPFTKPHPEPLLEAARRLSVTAEHCVYVGDDERDITAARAAGMRSVAAAYGYLGDSRPPSQWRADHVLAAPLDLLKLLASAPFSV